LSHVLLGIDCLLRVRMSQNDEPGLAAGRAVIEQYPLQPHTVGTPVVLFALCAMLKKLGASVCLFSS